MGTWKNWCPGDSPPILGVSDASVLASEVDLTMIVVQHRKLPRNMLLRVKQAIENVGGQVIGVVLNNVDVQCADTSLIGPQQPGRQPHERGLAGAIGADKTGHFAHLNADVDGL